MIKINDSEITAIYIGNNAVSVGYLGEYEIFSAGDWRFVALNEDLDPASAGDEIVGYGVKAYKGKSATPTIPSSYKELPVLTILSNFASNSNSMTSVTIANTIEIIRDSAFAYSQVSSVNFESNSSLETIEHNAFADSGLTSITFPSSLRTIGEIAFANTGLTSIALNEGLTTIESSAFQSCSSLTSVIFPSTLTALPANCFSGCGFTSITLPNTITTLGEQCFNNCSSLTSVTLPTALTTIPQRCFYSCKLTSLTIPASVITIGSEAFYGNSFSTLVIPDTVTSIDTEAFAYCNSLNNPTVSNSITIMDDIFYGCSGLTTLNIPSSVTTLSQTHSGLTTLTVAENSSLRTISSLQYNKFTSITIPNGVTTLGDGLLLHNPTLTSVSIPGTVKTIPSRCVGRSYGDSYRTITITLGEGIETIKGGAFEGQIGLSNITFPSTVTSYGSGDLVGNTMYSWTWKPAGVCFKGSATFESDCFYTATFVNGALYWDGTIAEWCNNTFKTKSGHPMYNSNFAKNEVYIKDASGSVTHDGKTYSAWHDIIIPNTVTTIKPYTFLNFTKTHNITIPASVTTINTSAFEGCINLEYITLETTDPNVGYLMDLYNMDYAFENVVKFRVHLDIADKLVELGWDPKRYVVMESVLLTGINYNNLPSSFAGESFDITPNYEPAYANTGCSLLYSASPSGIVTLGVDPIATIEAGVTSQTVTITARRPEMANPDGSSVNLPALECSKDITVTYRPQGYTLNLTAEGTWTASSGETVDNNQVYKSRYDVVGTDTCIITLQGYSTFEVDAKCYANFSYKKLYVYEVNSTSQIKSTIAAQSAYKPIVYEGLDPNNTYTIQIKFVSTKSYSGGERLAKFYINEQNCS